MLESDFNFIACCHCFLSDQNIGKLVVGIEGIGCISIKNRMNGGQGNVLGLVWPSNWFFAVPNMIGVGQYLIGQLEITAEIEQGGRSFGKRCVANGVSGKNSAFV